MHIFWGLNKACATGDWRVRAGQGRECRPGDGRPKDHSGARATDCPLPCVLLRAGTFCPRLGMCQLAGGLSEKSRCWKLFSVLLSSYHILYGHHSRGISVAKNIPVIKSLLFVFVFFSSLGCSLRGSRSGLRLLLSYPCAMKIRSFILHPLAYIPFWRTFIYPWFEGVILKNKIKWLLIRYL